MRGKSQRKLLAESELTFDHAYTLAQMVEASERDAKTIAGDNPPPAPAPPAAPPQQELNYTYTGRRTRTPGISCHRCGGPHLAPQCKHKDATCNACGKKGNFASVCMARRQKPQGKPSQSHQDKKPSTRTHYLNEELPSDQVEYDMYTLSDKSTEPYLLDVTLNDVPLKMELDT